jgi:hypothetical protein
MIAMATFMAVKQHGWHKQNKTKISAINPRAFFTAYGCHEWNMLLGNAAKSSRMVPAFLA